MIRAHGAAQASVLRGEGGAYRELVVIDKVRAQLGAARRHRATSMKIRS